MAGTITLEDAIAIQAVTFKLDDALFNSKQELNEWHQWYVVMEDEQIERLYAASALHQSFEQVLLDELREVNN